jgi:hypothetical protein
VRSYAAEGLGVVQLKGAVSMADAQHPFDTLTHGTADTQGEVGVSVPRGEGRQGPTTCSRWRRLNQVHGVTCLLRRLVDTRFFWLQ